MSHVASVIVWTAIEESNAMQGVQSWLRAEIGGVLVQVNNCASSGTKVVEVDWWAGAFNYLRIPEFLAVVFAQEWEHPESVRVIIQDEHDDAPTMYAPSLPPETGT